MPPANNYVMATQTKQLSTILKELVQQSNSQTRRLRLAEERLGILSGRAEAAEDAQQVVRKRAEVGSGALEERLKKIEGRVADLERGVAEVVTEVKKLPTSVQVRELENLIQIFNPVKSQFVTREEIDLILMEKLRRRI